MADKVNTGALATGSHDTCEVSPSNRAPTSPCAQAYTDLNTVTSSKTSHKKTLFKKTSSKKSLTFETSSEKITLKNFQKRKSSLKIPQKGDRTSNTQTLEHYLQKGNPELGATTLLLR